MSAARSAGIAVAALVLGCGDPTSRRDEPGPRGRTAAPIEASTAPRAQVSSAAGISGGGDLPPADKRSQCNLLIAIINRSVNRLRRDGETGDDGTAHLQRMADSLGQTEREVSLETYDYAELEALRREYGRLVSDAAREAHAMAAAARTNDVAKMSQAETRLERALALETPFMRRLNAFCR